MFTGIITDVGAVRAVVPGGVTRYEIETAYDLASIAIGASIACSGACHTVVEKGAGWFAVESSAETLSKTTLGNWQVGTPVNLERPLKASDELGGHMVSGHVDGVGEVMSIEADGDSKRFSFAAPAGMMRFIAPKGSVAVDGVSLTVNEVEGDRFGVNIIPHTEANTTFGRLQPGDPVNLEIDLVARYVARLLEKDNA
ncbi:MAG: riboflavin synthase [Rhodospirillales bacterium]|jgi:riboflavin synthase|nr:riboflavin synthase [Rhodospirillaceae bacterium]MDP6646023.1 riboflavin synthase [Rhodospirillales bacterium]MDP6841208.1 riboflavin synthase [Rhodospirillales bacterium]|tara:strand:- start:1677 stop:2270 length:594 start_codon:yes stop_codon:yes gene_type:complete